MSDAGGGGSDVAAACTASPEPTTTVGPTVYAIGDIGPGAGLVFYISNGGLNGLEAAPTGQVRSEWGCFGINIPGATGTGIGDGAANTQAILAAGCNVGTDAANVASNVGAGWFLPSKDELNAMYTELHVNRGLGGFLNNEYWSSSLALFTTADAWLQDFGNGSQREVDKGFARFVYAARAF